MNTHGLEWSRGRTWRKAISSIPLAFVRQRAARADDRLRLLPPYREHLSQAFARYFMRVGLPQDIRPFR